MIRRKRRLSYQGMKHRSAETFGYPDQRLFRTSGQNAASRKDERAFPLPDQCRESPS